jgi:hypothetical protein
MEREGERGGEIICLINYLKAEQSGELLHKTEQNIGDLKNNT